MKNNESDKEQENELAHSEQPAPMKLCVPGVVRLMFKFRDGEPTMASFNEVNDIDSDIKTVLSFDSVRNEHTFKSENQQVTFWTDKMSIEDFENIMFMSMMSKKFAAGNVDLSEEERARIIRIATKQ